MKLYYIDVDYLRKFDSRVSWNKHQRPYIGVVLTIIDEPPLSYILINDMIPVTMSNLELVDLSKEQQHNHAKYLLLMTEINYIRPRQTKIQRQASQVYQNTTIKKLPFFERMCVNFKLLEAQSLLYRR